MSPVENKVVSLDCDDFSNVGGGGRIVVVMVQHMGCVIRGISMRIISGYARGRTIKAPAEGTRPTSDRAKEGLFSSLGVRFGFDGARVLDLFAGSGALGLEAISRGAESVVFVDTDAGAIDTIRENIRRVGNVNADVVRRPVSSYLAGAPQDYFDIVFIDPPYALIDDAVHDILVGLAPHVRDGAAVVVERSSASAETAWPHGYEPTGQKLKKRTYGAARMDMASYTRPVEDEH